LQEIHRITSGVPRNIVKLANEALIKTAVDQAQAVTIETVRAASNELTVDHI
jgi:hypothetical protein